MDDLEFELIDAGMEELEENEEIFYAYTDYTNLGELSAALDRLNIDVKKVMLKRFPNDPVEFSEEQLEEIEKLLDKLEEDDDVQAVYTNIACIIFGIYRRSGDIFLFVPTIPLVSPFIFFILFEIMIKKMIYI